MRLRLSYMTIAVMAITIMAITPSCVKTHYLETENQEYEIPISFRAGMESKSLFEPDNFDSAGNQIMVYDKLTSESGSTVMHIDGATARADGKEWDFTDKDYYWTKSGTHSFTAWSHTNAADGTTASGVTYDPETEKLTVSMTSNRRNQFDFMYAYHERSMDEVNPYRPVPLQFSHIFCAVKFNVISLIRSSDLSFGGMYIYNVCTDGTAEIEKGTANIVTDANSAGSITISPTAAVGLEYNVAHNVFAGSFDIIGDDGYMLLWPHSTDLLKNINAQLSISGYSSQYISMDLLTDDVNRWRPGQKYTYNIYIQENRISFEVKVVPWKVDDVILDER